MMYVRTCLGILAQSGKCMQLLFFHINCGKTEDNSGCGIVFENSDKLLQQRAENYFTPVDVIPLHHSRPI